MKKLGFALGAFLFVVVLSWWAIGADWRRLVLSAPTDSDVLFWSVDHRDAAFRMMDRVPILTASRSIKSGSEVHGFEEGRPISLEFDMETYVEQNRTAGIVVVHDGAIRYETYGLDFSENGRWTSFSVAKSLTSTLVGAALKDGYIGSLSDKVPDYISGLRGSAYDDVTIEQLLTMSSGVAWNEDYEDPESDVAKFNSHVAEDGSSSLVSYMSALPRAHPPGDVWNYSTGETNMIGVLVREATGKSLTEYLSEKIWSSYGMQQDASWLLNDEETEISGCCIQAATRDFARFGQFILDGAVVDGQSILPEEWLQNATTARIRYGVDGRGYGYQWWTFDDGTFAALGIFGQSIFIDPERRLVIASNSSWRSALGRRDGENPARDEFHAAVIAAIDREQQQNSN
ncbi:MAG: serine hydrolase [Pseudomonadota bacterium]